MEKDTQNLENKTSFSCTSPATASKEEVPPSTSTQTQASSSTFTNDKVMILLKPVGEAKQLKKEYSRIKVDKNCTIFLLGQRIRRMLDMQATDSLYLFVKEAFAPSPDHTVSGDDDITRLQCNGHPLQVKALQQCFGSDNGMLLIQYSTLPAWG
jgi:ubiquitin-like protein ATG12